MSKQKENKENTEASIFISFLKELSKMGLIGAAVGLIAGLALGGPVECAIVGGSIGMLGEVYYTIIQKIN